MSFRRTVVSILLAAIAGLSVAAPEPLRISVFPLFSGVQVSQGLIPLEVSLSNLGPDAQGTLSIQDGQYRMDYPVELPEGSSKELVVYTKATPYFQEPVVTLSTNRGSVTKAVDPAGMTAETGASILEIGGNPGDLSFLGHGETDTGTGTAMIVGASYVSPEKAPDRMAAYTGWTLIVLGPGSERMSDAAVTALKLAVMRGGQVLFPGGVPSLLFSDGRWQGVFPVRPLQPRTETHDSFLRSMALRNDGKKKTPAPPIKPYSVIDFEPLPGAITAKEGSHYLIAARNYGLGKAVFWGFDPLHGPVRDWPGLAKFMTRMAMRPLPNVHATVELASLDDPNAAFEASHFGAKPAGADYMPSGSSPFQVKVPTVSRVGSILALYFLCVIPVNFFVLARFKKREWGWFSAGAISIGFAGVVLYQAHDLYGLATSHSDTVYVIAQQGTGEAIATGTSQMFASSGGVYDLQMKGVDSIGGAAQYNGYRYGGGRYGQSDDDISALSPVDTGTVQLNQVRMKNLGLTEFRFEQLMEGDHLAHIAKSGADYVVSAGTALDSVELMAPEGNVDLGSMKAGQRKRISRSQLIKSNGIQDAHLDGVASQVSEWTDTECALVARAPNLAVGPTLGKRIQPFPVLIYFARTSE